MKVTTFLNPRHLYNRRHRIIPRLHQFINFLGIPVTAMDRRLAAYKNRHRGERAFIIGTGPSLHTADLDRLTAEITFGCNKIFLAFEETDWRPTYYTILDVILAEQNRTRIQELKLKKFFSCWVKPYFPRDPEILWLRHLAHPVFHHGHIHSFQFSTNALAGVYGGWTVIYTQLQLAFYMGIREIYLLGIDFNFKVSPATDEVSMHGEILENRDELNHFHPDYRKPGEKWTMPRLDLQRQAFLRAKKSFETHGGMIYNASRQTALDVFPRVTFDDIVAG